MTETVIWGWGFYHDEEVSRQQCCRPRRATPGSAAWDLAARVPFTLLPGATVKVPLGVRMRVPAGWWMAICSRSGLALNQQLTVANSPGVVDSDFRGEVCALIHNQSSETRIISKGDYVCQALLMPVPPHEPVEVDDICADETERGDGGWGHSG